MNLPAGLRPSVFLREEVGGVHEGASSHELQVGLLATRASEWLCHSVSFRVSGGLD